MEADTRKDRFVCGDVGYGKTEVAIRAAFKAITVNELLSHSSGLEPDLVWQDVDVVKAAHHPLPMTSQDLAHYVAKAKLAGKQHHWRALFFPWYIDPKNTVAVHPEMQLTNQAFIEQLARTGLRRLEAGLEALR